MVWPTLGSRMAKEQNRTAGYLSKVADFDPPHLHSAPSYGLTPVEFCSDIRHQKTGVPGLSCGVVYVILRLAVLVELDF